MSNNLSQWLTNELDVDIEMSSRIRLARNIKGVPFPNMLKNQSPVETLATTLTRTLPDYKEVMMAQLESGDKALLVEKHLISPLFTRNGYSTFINNDESVSIMVNEEDHLRIQVMGASVSMDALYEKALAVDEQLEKELDYAFDEQYGFLTACPTNVGTGMRASVMLHLPALSLNNRIARFQSNLNRFGFALRGIYGEGSIPLGHVYQLSNELTLGQTEEEIINNLQELKHRIIEEEREIRRNLLEYHLLQTKDTINRSYGILNYAYTLTLKEAAMHLSNLKLGIDLDLLQKEDFKFQEWIQLIQPAFIKQRVSERSGEYLSLENVVDEERATLMREGIGGK